MIDAHAILAASPASLPRYTSYPTAPHFNAADVTAALAELRQAAAAASAVSAYVHVPFCDRLCWFCGCHTRHTLRHEPVAEYVDSLVREIGAFAGGLAAAPAIANLHLGGGSPSMLTAAEFARLRAAFADAFGFADGAEIAVEIDPGDAGSHTFEGLAELGATRASIGVQDFDPAVQEAINRPQGFARTSEVIAALRALGIASINIDMLYGLPLQTLPRLLATARQVIELAPDRIALFGYAHVPWMKKHQQLIREQDLPDTNERFDHANAAAGLFVAAGYERIGIDHFARPGDALALARASGGLHRNFQGYTTDASPVMLGFGASAIGRYPGGYVQNLVATGQYRQAVSGGRIPAGRALRLTADDRIRGHMIERLMCDFAISARDLEAEFPRDAKEYLALAGRIADVDGLLVRRGDDFVMPAVARPFARLVASRFDAYFKESQFRYSRAV